jgi:hypothetical protein
MACRPIGRLSLHQSPLRAGPPEPISSRQTIDLRPSTMANVFGTGREKSRAPSAKNRKRSDRRGALHFPSLAKLAPPRVRWEGLARQRAPYCRDSAPLALQSLPLPRGVSTRIQSLATTGNVSGSAVSKRDPPICEFFPKKESV